MRGRMNKILRKDGGMFLAYDQGRGGHASHGRAHFVGAWRLV